MIDKPLCMKV